MLLRIVRETYRRPVCEYTLIEQSSKAAAQKALVIVSDIGGADG